MNADPLSRRVLDTLPFNLAMLDPDGVIVDTNRAWREFGDANGLSAPSDTVGVDYFDAIEDEGDEYAERAVEGIRAVLAGRRGVFTLEYPCHSPNERRWFLCRATAFEHGGERYATVAHIDITDRRLAELEAERRAEELATERDQLALLNQIVRHDIRNDLAIVDGWADVLEDHVTSGGADALRRVHTATTRAQRLIAAVRDLTEVLDGGEPELSGVSLSDVLREEIERVRSTYDYRSDSVTIRAPDAIDDRDLPVVATPLLSSVFGNLLDNAVIHNDKERVEVTVAVEDHDDRVVVRIADNGPGVPDSRKREVFGRSEKGLESPGSGLGLYLVDQLVDIYGGSVWIEDNEPDGSVFCVELRRA